MAKSPTPPPTSIMRYIVPAVPTNVGLAFVVVTIVLFTPTPVKPIKTYSPGFVE